VRAWRAELWRRRDEVAAAEIVPGARTVLLDGVEDPYTYGQAVRALYAAGADGLVVPTRSWETAAGIVARSSAGTSELLATAQVAGVEEAAERCRAAGLQVVCAATAPDAIPIEQLDVGRGMLLIIGGERRGIRRSFLAGCDVRVAIPYARPDAPPLSAAAAAAVIGFEAFRRRITERTFGLDQRARGVGETSG
jgi:23S rRNA (guanosine2251-2'-O)-methyltransferase